MTSIAVRPELEGTFALDRDQSRALAARGPLLRVLGGAGTGKSTLAVHLVADRVRRAEVRADQALILAPTRRAAAAMRERVTRELGATTGEPLARTFASFAFGVLRRVAIREDLPTPYLLSGAEQDAILRELLAGHAHAPGAALIWPPEVAQALGTRGFRGELRDLLMRAVEHGLDAVALAELGRAHGRPEWVAAAAVLDEYDQVTALATPGGYDPAWLLTGAADALESDPELLAELARDVRLVVIDDAQEVGESGARLLAALADAGIDIVLIGDPDAAVQTFRGADPLFLADGWTRLSSRSADLATTMVLGTCYGIPQEVAAAAARVTRCIGALGGGAQRQAVPVNAGGSVTVSVFRSAAQEAAYLADTFRRAHLLDGVAWRDMAVIVRGQGRADVVRRVLAAAHIPVSDGESDIPLGQEDAVRPMLQLLRAAGERAACREAAPPLQLAADPDGGWRLAPEVAVDLLTSPYGGADAVTLRRVRRGVRRAALDDDAQGASPADVLLAVALARPARLADLGPEAAGARRVARMLDAATRAISLPGARADDVLWAMWQAADVAGEWRSRALAGGRFGARADRDLDAVIAVLAAASHFADRLPGISAAAFAQQVVGLDVAADSIVNRGLDRERVAVLTPHAAAGRSWKYVAVAGVQEGSWPDPRVRGSLLGSPALVDAMRGRDISTNAAQVAIRHDEARLFHVAVTRAREWLHISAVRDVEQMPSPYLDVVAPGTADEGERPFTSAPAPMTLVGVVAGLRRCVTTPPSAGVASAGQPDGRARRAEAASILARLAEAGIRGADPASWWALREVTDDRPRVAPGKPIRVSPSALVGFERCQVRWLLTSCGGQGPGIGSAALGTLVHEVLSESADEGVAAMAARLDSVWGRLGLGSGWIGRAKRAEANAMLRQAASYVDYARAGGWRRLGAEVQFRAMVGRVDISGVVDRLETNAEGHLRIIDYKTGSAKPKQAEVARHPQLGAYQVAIAAGAFPEGSTGAGAALVQLGKASTKNIASSVQIQGPLTQDPDPHWAQDMVVDSAEAMGGSRFVALVGEGCRTCPVASSCPARPEGGMLA